MNDSMELIRSNSVATTQQQPTGHFPKDNIYTREASIFKVCGPSNKYAIQLPGRFVTHCYRAVGDLRLQSTLNIRKVDGTGVLKLASLNAGFLITDLRSGLEYILSRNGTILFLYEKLERGTKRPIAEVTPSNRRLFRGKKWVVRVVDETTKISSFGRKKFSLWNLVRRGNAFHVKASPGYDVMMCVALQLCCDAIEGGELF